MEFSKQFLAFFRRMVEEYKFLSSIDLNVLSHRQRQSTGQTDCRQEYLSDTIYRVEHEHNAIERSRQTNMYLAYWYYDEGLVHILLYNFYYLFSEGGGGVAEQFERGVATLVRISICKLFKLVLFLCNFLRGTFCAASPWMLHSHSSLRHLRCIVSHASQPHSPAHPCAQQTIAVGGYVLYLCICIFSCKAFAPWLRLCSQIHVICAHFASRNKREISLNSFHSVQEFSSSLVHSKLILLCEDLIHAVALSKRWFYHFQIGCII